MSNKNITIDFLYKSHKSGRVKIPEAQRPQEIWSIKRKALLMDSIIRGYPIPQFFAVEKKRGEMTTELSIYDGQQRTEAIVDFINGKYKLPDGLIVGDEEEKLDCSNKKWGELDPEIQGHIESYNLNFVMLDGYKQKEVDEIFVRLQNGVPLTPFDVRYAKGGKMRDTIKSIVEDKEGFFNVCMKPKKNNRDHQVIASAMMLVHLNGSMSVGVGELNGMYEQHKNNDLPNEVKSFKRVLSLMSEIFGTNGVNNNMRTAHMIPLFLAVKKLDKEYVVNETVKERMADWLSSFEHRYYTQKRDSKFPDMCEYFRHAANGSDGRTAVQGRVNIMWNDLLLNMTGLVPKDGQRRFNEDERKAIFKRDSGCCRGCGTKCDPMAWHADHVNPHVNGGQTTIENGQVLCVKCNLEKGAKIAQTNKIGALS